MKSKSISDKPKNDYTVRRHYEVTVQASSPEEAFREAEQIDLDCWGLDTYEAECEQCDEVFDKTDSELPHDCPVLKRLNK